MREYKFKRGFKPHNERLEEMMEKHFDSFEVDGEVYVAKFGAATAKMWIEDKILKVDTETDTDAPNDVAAHTVKVYNKFLEDLTGYTAKQRQKMMKKDAEKDK
ncbi:MAG: DUF5611 family protein [Archaeoglobaceae archaeon]